MKSLLTALSALVAFGVAPVGGGTITADFAAATNWWFDIATSPMDRGFLPSALGIQEFFDDERTGSLFVLPETAPVSHGSSAKTVLPSGLVELARYDMPVFDLHHSIVTLEDKSLIETKHGPWANVHEQGFDLLIFCTIMAVVSILRVRDRFHRTRQRIKTSK